MCYLKDRKYIGRSIPTFLYVDKVVSLQKQSVLGDTKKIVDVPEGNFEYQKPKLTKEISFKN